MAQPLVFNRIITHALQSKFYNQSVIVRSYYLSQCRLSKNTKTDLDKVKSTNQLPQLEVKERVKENAKTAGYSMVILGGVAFTGLIFWVVGKELFSNESPTGVYDRAMKRCLQDGRVTATLGDHIKGYGETDRRGRRRHVAHQIWLDSNGKRHMALKFHLSGSTNTATVWVEMKEDDKGKLDYDYLVVEAEQYPKRTIVIENKREARMK